MMNSTKFYLKFNHMWKILTKILTMLSQKQDLNQKLQCISNGAVKIRSKRKLYKL